MQPHKYHIHLNGQEKQALRQLKRNGKIERRLADRARCATSSSFGPYIPGSCRTATSPRSRSWIGWAQTRICWSRRTRATWPGTCISRRGRAFQKGISNSSQSPRPPDTAASARNSSRPQDYSAFNWPDIELIRLTVNTSNAPALRLYERLGFARERTMMGFGRHTAPQQQ